MDRFGGWTTPGPHPRRCARQSPRRSRSRNIGRSTTGSRWIAAPAARASMPPGTTVASERAGGDLAAAHGAAAHVPMSAIAGAIENAGLRDRHVR